MFTAVLSDRPPTYGDMLSRMAQIQTQASRRWREAEHVHSKSFKINILSGNSWRDRRKIFRTSCCAIWLTGMSS
jgi:hypothetical protein